MGVLLHAFLLHRRRLVITNGKRIGCYILLMMLLFITGCGAATETAVISDIQMISIDDNELLFVTDIDRTIDFKSPEYIDLSQTEEALVIENGGDYVLAGEYHQTVTVDAHDEQVHLFLNNTVIETAVGPAINIKSAGKVVITLMEGTMNTLSDAAYYSDDDLNAAISAACDLTINGSGSLYVCGYYKDAIHTKDVFKLLDGMVQLKSKRYGIKGNDGIVLEPENLIIESEKNGCQTSNANKEDKGIIDIRGGEISIVAGEYALSSVSDVYVRDGEIYLNSVIEDIYTEGQQYIAEGVFANE